MELNLKERKESLTQIYSGMSPVELKEEYNAYVKDKDFGMFYKVLMKEIAFRNQNNSKEDSFALCDILMSAFSANMVELHVHAPHFAREPGDHPVASPYARLQAQKTSLVTNLCHRNIDLEKSYGRFILPLLDGSRDRSAMREEMVEIIRSNKLSLNAKPYSEKTTEELNAEIDQELLNCARHALLVA